MTKILNLANRHVVATVPVGNLDDRVTKLPNAAEYDSFYIITMPSLNKDGAWVVAKGHKQAPRQWVVWYPNGRMFSGYGMTMTEALNSAIEGAYFYI